MPPSARRRKDNAGFPVVEYSPHSGDCLVNERGVTKDYPCMDSGIRSQLLTSDEINERSKKLSLSLAMYKYVEL